nr:hypothetical protein [Vagococcus vulneris]
MGGSFIAEPEKLSLDFIIVAMFIGLIYLQLVSDKNLYLNPQLIMIETTLIIVFVGLFFISNSILVLAATLIGCIVEMVIKHVFF